jgi:predicted ATPase
MLASNGSDLVQAIYTHRNENTKQYNEPSDLIYSMFKEISGILTVPSGNNLVTLSLRDNFSGQNIPISECVTGIAPALHLASMILFSEPRKIFLIDELHVYLHPWTEKLLMKFIREHREHIYVISTPSPIFIQAVWPDIVYIVIRGSEGTRVKESLLGVQSKRLLLEELGVNLGDMSIAEKIFLVEGRSEVDIISVMLEKTGLSKLNINY